MVNEVDGGKLTRDAGIGMAAMAVYSAGRLFMAPMVLSYISLEAYGLWSMMFVLLGWLAWGGFGVHAGYIKLTATYEAEGSLKRIGRLVVTGSWTMAVCLSTAALLVWGTTPAIGRLISVPTSLWGEAAILIPGIALCCLLDQTLGGFRSVLEGFRDLATVKTIQTATALAELGLVFLFLSTGGGVRGLLFGYLLRILIESAACYAVLCRKYPEIGLRLFCFDRAELRALLAFGGRVQVSGALAMIASGLDRLLIGAGLGLGAVGLFEIARKLPHTAKSISGAAFGPLLPESARLSRGAAPASLSALYPKGVRNNLLLNTTLFGFLAATAAPLLHVWLGEGYDQAVPLLMIMAAVSLCQQTTGPVSMILRGRDNHRAEWIYSSAQIVLTLVVVPLALRSGELRTAAWSLVAVALLCTALFLVLGNRAFGIGTRECLTRMLLPGLVPLLPAVVLGPFTHHLIGDGRIESLIGIAVAGLVTTGFSMALIWALILDPSEKSAVRTLLVFGRRRSLPC